MNTFHMILAMLMNLWVTRCIALNSDTIIMSRLLLPAMRYKSKISRLNLDSEAAKELELDEQARPTRKLESPAVPTTDSTTTLTHRRLKGMRKIR